MMHLYFGSQWDPKLLPTAFKISSAEESNTEQYEGESKWWQNLDFWLNYFFVAHVLSPL